MQKLDGSSQMPYLYTVNMRALTNKKPGPSSKKLSRLMRLLKADF